MNDKIHAIKMISDDVLELGYIDETTKVFRRWYNKTALISFANSLEKGFHKPGIARSTIEMLMLIVTEISECCEAFRQEEMPKSDHIFPYNLAEEELADAIIRIMDLGAYMNLDVGGALAAKMKFNRTRPYMHGKKA